MLLLAYTKCIGVDLVHKNTFLPEKVGEGEELGCEMTGIQVIVY